MRVDEIYFSVSPKKGINRMSSTDSEPKLVGNSESFQIFQLVCSASFEREMRKNGDFYILILSSQKAKHGVRDESKVSFFFLTCWKFLKRWNAKDAEGSGDLNQAETIF